MHTDEFAARTENLKTRLYRIAILYLGSESMALDAVGEAVYHGFLGLKKLRQPEYFDTWMTRILINECKKELRRRRVRDASAEEPQPETAADYDALPLREAVRQLPQELREVVILRYFSDYTLAQTAESLTIPQGTVVTRQRRALKLLRLELEDSQPQGGMERGVAE